MTSTLLSDNFIRNVRITARILDSINHRLRKRILHEIETYGSLNVEALSSLLDIKSRLVIQHLEVLRKEKIVTLHREGKQFFYEINYERLEKINTVIHGLAEDY